MAHINAFIYFIYAYNIVFTLFAINELIFKTVFKKEKRNNISGWLEVAVVVGSALAYKRKARIRIPGRASKRNMKKYFFNDYLSADF